MSRRRYPHPLFGDGWFSDDWPPARRPRWPEPRVVERPAPRRDLAAERRGPYQPVAEPAPEPRHAPTPTPAPRSIPIENARTAPPAPPVPDSVDEPAAIVDAEPDKQRLRDALRELERSRERVERDAARVADETKRGLIAQLLPLLDNLDRSIAAAAAAADDSPLRDGVELVRAQFEKILLGYGVEKLDAVGRPFDPNEHDAIAVVAVDDHRRDGVVVDEWAPGYRLGDRVLRAAKVRVGKLAA